MDQSTRDMVETDFKRFFNNVGKRRDYVGDIVVIKVRKLVGCSLDVSNPIPKFNMVPDSEYGVIKTKFKVFYDGDYKMSISTARDFDTLIVFLLNKGKGIIEKVYAIPKKELEGKRGITLNDTEKIYKKFRIDEKPYNDIYRRMRTEKYSIFEDDTIVITGG